jgi:arylsulfatase A-like enzyme
MLCLFVLLAAIAFRSQPALGETAKAKPAQVSPNILIVIADDLGIDQLKSYGAKNPPSTPVIDRLAARSRIFEVAWSTPTCSPARAALLTGKLPSRTGITSIVRAASGQELLLSEITLPEMLAEAPEKWSSSAIGKWHLASLASPSAAGHAKAQGFGWWSGSMGNIGTPPKIKDDVERGYYHWEKVLPDGRIVVENTFATTDTIDDALARIAAMPEPWLAWVSLNAPHVPLSLPPEALAPGPHGTSERAIYQANVTALDTELGRLLAKVDPKKTTVIFLADNGSPKLKGSARAKGTVFEHGVRVPLMVSGPLVTVPGRTEALVHVVDLFPTLAEIAGVDLGALGPVKEADGSSAALVLDGTSLLPLLRDAAAPWAREVLFTEWGSTSFDPNPSRVKRAVRDRRYKLIYRKRLGKSEHLFYDLETDPDERKALPLKALSPEVKAVYDGLLAKMLEYTSR